MEIRFHGLDEIHALAWKWDAWWPGEPLDALGLAVVEDAQERIMTSTTAPDGSQWDPWSAAYAATRTPRNKLLLGEGDLATSLDHQVRGNMVEAGSPLDYALVHQFGSRDGRIPQRAYMGISKGLKSELEDSLAAEFERRI